MVKKRPDAPGGKNEKCHGGGVEGGVSPNPKGFYQKN